MAIRVVSPLIATSITTHTRFPTQQRPINSSMHKLDPRRTSPKPTSFRRKTAHQHSEHLPNQAARRGMCRNSLPPRDLCTTTAIPAVRNVIPAKAGIQMRLATVP